MVVVLGYETAPNRVAVWTSDPDGLMRAYEGPAGPWHLHRVHGGYLVAETFWEKECPCGCEDYVSLDAGDLAQCLSDDGFDVVTTEPVDIRLAGVANCTGREVRVLDPQNLSGEPEVLEPSGWVARLDGGRVVGLPDEEEAQVYLLVDPEVALATSDPRVIVLGPPTALWPDGPDAFVGFVRLSR